VGNQGWATNSLRRSRFKRQGSRGKGVSLRGGAADVAIQGGFVAGCVGSPRPCGPRDDVGWRFKIQEARGCHCEEAQPTWQSPRIVIARRRSRRGNPPPHRHCEEAEPTWQSPRIVIARRRSRRGNPPPHRHCEEAEPTWQSRGGFVAACVGSPRPCGPRDDVGWRFKIQEARGCHCEEAEPTWQSRGGVAGCVGSPRPCGPRDDRVSVRASR
jgi:hypothetical protein